MCADLLPRPSGERRFRVSEELSHQMAAVAHTHGLDLVLLFGSQAVGPVHQESDFDLAIRSVGEPLDMARRLDLEVDLQRLFPGEVDVVDLRRADPLLLRNIFRSAVALYARAGAFE